MRTTLSINLTDEERLALRKILLDDGLSMAEFFARQAREHIRKRKLQEQKPEKARAK